MTKMISSLPEKSEKEREIKRDKQKMISKRNDKSADQWFFTKWAKRGGRMRFKGKRYNNEEVERIRMM